MASLEDMVAIVTGGASGIGAATAKRLARDGVAVTVADVDVPRAEMVTEAIRASGGTAMVVQTDVSDENAVGELVERTVSEYGRLDIMHNNAALLGLPDNGDASITDIRVAQWDKLYAINVRGVMLGTKYAVPHLIRAGGGSIINTTSSACGLGDVRSVYASAKGSVSAFTLATAVQFGKQGIRCNAIAPGLMVHEGNRDQLPAAYAAMFLKHTLLPRLGRAEDIANTVAFLASDDGCYITGQILGVDGGLATHLPYVGDLIDSAANQGG